MTRPAPPAPRRRPSAAAPTCRPARPPDARRRHSATQSPGRSTATCRQRHRPAAPRAPACPRCSGTDRSDRELAAPQQVKQHRQHRDRITRRCRARHQRRRRREHPPQHLARRLGQVVARMPVPGQPPQVRGHDRHRPHRPAGTPTRPCAHARAVASNFATSRGLRRSTGRQSTTTAEPSARRAKKSGACETSLPASSRQAAKTVGTRCRPLSGRNPAPSRDRVPSTTRSRRARRSWPTTTARSDAAAPCVR